MRLSMLIKYGVLPCFKHFSFYNCYQKSGFNKQYLLTNLTHIIVTYFLFHTPPLKQSELLNQKK